MEMLLDGTGGKTSPPPGLRTRMFAAPERPTSQQPSLAAERLGNIPGKKLHHSAGAVYWRSHVAEVVLLTKSKSKYGAKGGRVALLQKGCVSSLNPSYVAEGPVRQPTKSPKREFLTLKKIANVHHLAILTDGSLSLQPHQITPRRV